MEPHHTKEVPGSRVGRLVWVELSSGAHTALQQNTARVQPHQSLQNPLEEPHGTQPQRLCPQAQKGKLEVSLGYPASACLKTSNNYKEMQLGG